MFGANPGEGKPTGAARSYRTRRLVSKDERDDRDPRLFIAGWVGAACVRGWPVRVTTRASRGWPIPIDERTGTVMSVAVKTTYRNHLRRLAGRARARQPGRRVVFAGLPGDRLQADPRPVVGGSGTRSAGADSQFVGGTLLLVIGIAVAVALFVARRPPARAEPPARRPGRHRRRLPRPRRRRCCWPAGPRCGWSTGPTTPGDFTPTTGMIADRRRRRGCCSSAGCGCSPGPRRTRSWSQLEAGGWFSTTATRATRASASAGHHPRHPRPRRGRHLHPD